MKTSRLLITTAAIVAIAAPAASASPPRATPLTDRTTETDNQFPIVFVLFGLAIPLALVIAMIAAKPVRSYARSHRGRARVA